MILMYLYRVAKRYLYVFILTISACLSFAQYQNLNTTPIYASEVQLFISTPTPVVDIGALASGSNFGAQRVKSYAQLIVGPATLNPVIKKLKLNMTWQQLSGAITTNAPLDTVLVNVQVKSPDPILAAKIANSVAVQFQATVQSVESNVSDSEIGGEKVPLKVSIAKTATPNFTPISPKKFLNYALGIVFGSLLAFTYLGLLFIFDQRVKNEAHIFGYALLGVVRFDKKVRTNPIGIALHKDSARAETFRQIRSSIQYNLRETSPERKVILISSALPGEGKSVTATGLALTYAAAGLKVLLVDCDLRKPSQKSIFQIGGLKLARDFPDSELSSLLNNRRVPKPIIFSEFPNLNLIIAGDSKELIEGAFTSERFMSLVKKFRSQYDVILFDSPPVLLVSDSMQLFNISDISLIVVKAGHTRIAQLGRCLTLLDTGVKKVDAILLNMVPNSRFADEYGYGYGYTYRSMISYKATNATTYGFAYNPSHYEKEYSNYVSKNQKSHNDSNHFKSMHRSVVKIMDSIKHFYHTKKSVIKVRNLKESYVSKLENANHLDNNVKPLENWEIELKKILDHES